MTNPKPIVRWITLGLFLASGFAALVYEIVWVRSLMTVFGVSAFAVSTVLAAFMGGLALGSHWFGRTADRVERPLLLYALLETGIGVYALFVPVLFSAINPVLRLLYEVTGDSSPVLFAILRGVLAFGILGIPTTLMGATFPVLCRFFVRALSKVGTDAGTLYFVNTSGAVLGCAAAGFLLIPSLGLARSTLVAATINFGVAGIALLLSRMDAPSGPRLLPAEQPIPAKQALSQRTVSPAFILLAYALSGFAGLAFEVIWSRVLVLIFGSTVYSFTAMLTVFLAGLALGGVLFARLADRTPDPARLFARFQFVIALLILAAIASINLLPYLFLQILAFLGLNDQGLIFVKFLLSALVLLPITLFFGGTFPLASRAYLRSLSETGRSMGRLYAMNTVGAISGSLIAGFVFLPTLGMQKSLVLIAGISFAVGLALRIRAQASAERGVLRLWPTGLAAALFVALCFFLPPWNTRLLSAGVWFSPKTYVSEDGTITIHDYIVQTRTLYYAEGVNDTIIVNESPTERSLSINGKIIATSSWEDVLHLKMLGHLPVLLHTGTPKTALNIGLGIGGTVSALASYPFIERVDVAELEPRVIPAARLFSEFNNEVLDNPRLRVLLGDGRNHLLRTDEKYDLISSDPFHPYMTGAGNLYSLEFFQIAREHLKPGGLMTQWVPLHQLSTQDVRSIIKTFGTVYPHFTVWFSGRSIILIGSRTPFALGPETLAAKMRVTSNGEELVRLGMDSPEKLAAYLLGTEREYADYGTDAPLNTDDHPFIEYDSARRILERTSGPNLKDLSTRFMDPSRFGEVFLGTSASPFDTEEARRLASAVRDGIQGMVLEAEGRIGDALEHLHEAIRASGNPFLTFWLAEVHEKLGIVLQEAGRTDQAMAHYRVAVSLQQNRVSALANLGYLLTLEDETEEAEPFLIQALRYAPWHPMILYRTGLLRQAQGRLEEAQNLYRKALAVDPNLADARAALIIACLDLGDYECARTNLGKAFDHHPGEARFLELAAQLAVREQRFEDAEALCSQVLEDDPQSAACYFYRGLSFLAREEFENALQAFKEAARLTPQDPENHYQLARTYALLSRPTDAVSELRRAIELGGPALLQRAARSSVLSQFVQRGGSE